MDSLAAQVAAALDSAALRRAKVQRIHSQIHELEIQQLVRGRCRQQESSAPVQHRRSEHARWHERGGSGEDDSAVESAAESSCVSFLSKSTSVAAPAALESLVVGTVTAASLDVSTDRGSDRSDFGRHPGRSSASVSRRPTLSNARPLPESSAAPLLQCHPAQDGKVGGGEEHPTVQGSGASFLSLQSFCLQTVDNHSVLPFQGSDTRDAKRADLLLFFSSFSFAGRISYFPKHSRQDRDQ